MNATNIRKNDNVEIITGKDKGKRGRVIAVLTRKDRVLVENLNMIKKHMRPSGQNNQGGILEKEGSIHQSNVLLVCPKCDKSTRVGAMLLSDDRKVRVCKRCNEPIDK